MSWTDVADAVGAVFMLAGALLCLLAGIGLLRLPDVLTRMHAATKPQAMGLLLVLVGAGLWLRTLLDLTTLLLVGFFQLITSPVAAHMVGRAAARTGRMDRSSIVVDEFVEDLAGARPASGGKGPAEGDGDGTRTPASDGSAGSSPAGPTTPPSEENPSSER